MSFYFKCPHCNHNMVCEEQENDTIRECPECNKLLTVIKPLLQFNKPLRRDNVPKISINFKIADRIVTDCSKAEIIDELQRKLKQYSNKVTLYEDILYAREIFQSFFSIKYSDVIIEVTESLDGYFLNAKVKHRPYIFFWVWLLVVYIFFDIPTVICLWIFLIALYFYQKHMTKENIKGIFSHVRNRLSLNHKLPSSKQTTCNDFAGLEKLAELRDKGVVTQEEFEAKKKQILDL